MLYWSQTLTLLLEFQTAEVQSAGQQGTEKVNSLYDQFPNTTANTLRSLAKF